MPRPPKLRKKNGYWMTKAGGQEVYFGRVDEVAFNVARKLFSEHLATLDQRAQRPTILSCLEICDRHLEYVEKFRSTHSYKQRRHFLERWCDFKLSRPGGGVPVGALPYTEVDVADFQVWLDSLSLKLSLSSRRAAQTAVKACWNWAADDASLMPKEYRPFASMTKIRVPRKPLTEEDLISDAEADLLFEHADDDLGRIRGAKGRYGSRKPSEFRVDDQNPYRGFQDLLRFYYHTGARTSELANVCVRDVLHRTRQVVLGRHKREATLRTPEVRRITLNDEIYAIVNTLCHGKKPDDRVFTQANGNPWNKDRLNDRFAKVRARAGVRADVTIYSFRDLWISEALMAGNDIATVAKMAGTSIKMIEQVYGHFRNEHFELAQQRLDNERERRREKRRN